MKMRHLPIIACSVLLIACTQDKAANDNPANNNVMARQELMQDWRFASETLKGMADNPANFNAELAKTQTQLFVDSSAKMWAYFNDDKALGKAKETVWSDSANFQKAIEQFNTAAEALNTAAQNASQISDLESAMGQLGESCGSCHKAFKH